MIYSATYRRYPALALLMGVGVWAAGPSWAQQAAAGAADTGGEALEEIVVTARKASETLQTTPVAVTALSEATLTRDQLVDVADLQHATPDIAIGGGGTGPTSIVYLAIRGEAQNSPNSVSDNAVGIYVDGVYIARPIVGNQGFLDVNQVEVLRGPQGTLFGRNTTGGALTINSNQPTDQLEGYVKAGYGNFNEKLGEGVLNVPLVGNELDARVAFRYTDHDAYYTNPLNSAFDPAALKHDDEGRAQLKWAPSSVPLTIDWIFDYANMVDTGSPTALIGFNGGTNLGGLLPLPLGVIVPLVVPGLNVNNYLVNPFSGSNPNYRYSFGGFPTNAANPDPRINKPFNENRAEGLSQNLDLDVGQVHVKSITAYRWSDTQNTEDLAGLPINYYGFYSRYEQHQASEELQLSGKAGPFDLIGGVYYLEEGGTEESDAQAFAFFFPLAGQGSVTSDFTDFNSNSKGAFAQTNYHVTDTVRITAGFRYTWDYRQIDQGGRNNLYSSTGATAGPPNVCAVGVTAGTAQAAAGNPCSNLFETLFDYPAWTIGADWQANDTTFLYLKSSRASMAGGFNTRPVPATVPTGYGPESNTDIELGLKSDLFEHHLRTNVALFTAWQNNVQRITNSAVVIAGTATATQFETNSGKTRTHGAELEITALPWTGMEVTATGAWLHAAYVAGSFHELQVLSGTDTVVSVDRSGETVPQSPQYTFSIGATQTVPVQFGKLSFHMDYAWRDKLVYTSDTASALQPAAVQAQYALQNALGIIPAYGLLNARIAFNLDHPNLEFALWGKNLTNREYYTQQFDDYVALGVAEDFQGDPRTYGGTVQYRF